jgi:hypothetical protein
MTMGSAAARNGSAAKAAVSARLANASSNWRAFWKSRRSAVPWLKAAADPP